MSPSPRYANVVKAHKFVHHAGWSRCSCDRWFLKGASEDSAIRSHRLHIQNLPDERVLNPVRSTPLSAVPTFAAASEALRARSSEHKPTPATLGILCSKARRGIAEAKAVLGEQTVKGLLQTVTFRVVTA